MSAPGGFAGARGEAVLIGDSNAGHFTEPFVRAARRCSSATVATYSDLSVVDLRVPGGMIGEHDCRARHASLRELHAAGRGSW